MRWRRILIVFVAVMAVSAAAFTAPAWVFRISEWKRYGGPLPATEAVGAWRDASGRLLPDGGAELDRPLTIVTSRLDTPGCLRKVIDLWVAWPLGTTAVLSHNAVVSGDLRHYVRDPDDAHRGQVDGRPFKPDVTLPESAIETGYVRNGNTIRIDPGGDAYVVRPNGTVEQWPRQPAAVDFYCP